MKRIIAVLTAAALLAAAGVAVAKVRTGATSGTVWVAPTHSEGKDLYVSGDLKDRRLGRGAIVYVTGVAAREDGAFQVTARRVTAYFDGGSISGTGKAVQRIEGERITVSDGSFTLTKGTGALKGRRMVGTFSGEQRDGVYRFTYKGSIR
jgi:hypothetical protein